MQGRMVGSAGSPGVEAVTRPRRVRRLGVAAWVLAVVTTALLVAPPASAVALSSGHAAPGQAGGPPLPPGTTRTPQPRIYPGGGLWSYGAASLPSTALPPLAAPVESGAVTPDGHGVWLAGADGGVYALGDARFYGSAGAIHLWAPVVGMAATPDGRGYWLVAQDGGVFAFGDAHFYGSTGGMALNAPIVGMAATPDGKGYWLVGEDGGIFSFGDAGFYGSAGNVALDAPVVGMAATNDGKGYWLVAADGGVFTFGDAPFYGSRGGQALDASVMGLIPTPDDGGYTLGASDGGIFTFGNAPFYGSAGGGLAATPFSAILRSAGGLGYWLLDPDGYQTAFDNPAPVGSFPGSAQIVAAADSQVQPDPDTGYFCNPYGPCEEWCALFASWAIEQGGFPMPSYAFTGDIYFWAQQYGQVMSGLARPDPGDAVLYGTGPWTVDTSWHVGIVAQVWPNGSIDTIEGDAGPGTAGWLAVIINGPYEPADSINYNGMGIYAFAQP